MKSGYYHFLFYKPLCCLDLFNLFLQLACMTFVIQNNYMLIIPKFGSALDWVKGIKDMDFLI